MIALARALALGLAAATALGLAAQAESLRQVATIPIPGLDSYDIGYIAHGKYYYTNRTNKSVDVIDTKTNKLVGRITGFVGVGPGGPAGGPNGVIVIGNQVWAGDGDSTVKIADLKTGQVIQTIPTGGKKRADEVAYDPKDHIFIIGNDAEDPPFLTLISTQGNHPIVAKIPLPDAEGLEQPVYYKSMFYVAVPQIGKDEHNGGIAIVDPKQKKLVKIIPVQNCRPQGLDIGRGTLLVVGCNAGSSNTKNTPPMFALFDTKTEKLIPVTDKFGGADMAAYNKKLGLYLAGGREAPGGPSVAVVDAKTHQWIENIKVPPNPHSIAVDQATGRVYVPSGATGGSCGGCIVVLGR